MYWFLLDTKTSSHTQKKSAQLWVLGTVVLWVHSWLTDNPSPASANNTTLHFFSEIRPLLLSIFPGSVSLHCSTSILFVNQVAQDEQIFRSHPKCYSAEMDTVRYLSLDLSLEKLSP